MSETLPNHETQKTAGVIIIGNEILSGRTQDKNIPYIGKNLEKLGIVLAEVIVVPDVEETIIERDLYSKQQFRNQHKISKFIQIKYVVNITSETARCW